MKRKRLETLGLRRKTTKSLNKRSHIFVITTELQGIQVQISINGWPLNKEIVCSHLETRSNFHPLLLLREIFLKPLCSFRTLMDSILPPILRIKGLHKGKVLPQNLKGGRKKAPSDLFTLSLPLLAYLAVCFAFLFLSQSSFMLYVFLYIFVWLFSVFVFILFFIKKIENTKTMCVCVY